MSRSDHPDLQDLTQRDAEDDYYWQLSLELPEPDLIATRQLELHQLFLRGGIVSAEYEQRRAALADLRGIPSRALL